MILAGDVGGTKTVLALFERARPDDPHSELVVAREERFASADHAGLEDIIAAFLAGADDAATTGATPPIVPTAACFGVAGPVVGRRAKITNLPWTIDADAIAARFGIARVALLNDLQAAAYGALHLPADQLAVLQSGPTPAAVGNIAVVSAGTGLGEAILYWDGARYHALASEGGHTDFAPQSDRDIRLLVYLRERFGGHVSWERVVSGDGLGAIYDFMRDVEELDVPAELAAQLASSADRNAAIAEAALAGAPPIAVAALAQFVTLLGAEAGNLALKCFASGGVIIAGGIPPKILPALSDGRCLAALTDKGRFSAWLAGLRVVIALDPRAPLLGAAHHLADHLAHHLEGVA